jgi:hypothetical protein
MDVTEQQIIDELFGRLYRVERQSGPREPQAEAYIQGLMNRQPGAPYYMAQVIILQEQALLAAQSRIEELERQLEELPSGGFLGSLFGEPSERRGEPRERVKMVDPRISPYFHSHYANRGGNGFLSGALQTALGVTGGVLLGNALADAFAMGEAAAAEPTDLPEADFGDFDTGIDDF